MSAAANVQKVRRLFEAFYAADEPAMTALIGDNFITHAPGGASGNAEGWKSMARQLAKALPDNHTEIHEIIGEGDMVAVRYTSKGTHCETLFGVPATNKLLTTGGMEMYRFAEGQIVECWGQYDMSELFASSS